MNSFPVGQTVKKELEDHDLRAKEALKNYCEKVLGYTDVIYNPKKYEVDVLIYRQGKLILRLNTQTRRRWPEGMKFFPGENFDLYHEKENYKGKVIQGRKCKLTDTVHVPIRNIVECDWINRQRQAKLDSEGKFIYKKGDDVTDFYITQSWDCTKSIWLPAKAILSAPVVQNHPDRNNYAKIDTFFGVPISKGFYRDLRVD